MDKDSGLGNGGLAEIFVGTGKHEVGYAESEDFVGFLEKRAGFGVVVVELFAHADELRSLTREYICFHFGVYCKLNKIP